jgi:hypothetical protein
MLVIVIEFVHSARTGFDQQKRGRLSGRGREEEEKRKRRGRGECVRTS